MPSLSQYLHLAYLAETTPLQLLLLPPHLPDAKMRSGCFPGHLNARLATHLSHDAYKLPAESESSLSSLPGMCLLNACVLCLVSSPLSGVVMQHRTLLLLPGPQREPRAHQIFLTSLRMKNVGLGRWRDGGRPTASQTPGWCFCPLPPASCWNAFFEKPKPLGSSVLPTLYVIQGDTIPSQTQMVF